MCCAFIAWVPKTWDNVPSYKACAQVNIPKPKPRGPKY